MADDAPISCPTCATEHPPGSRFCPQCGARLVAVGETAEITADPVLTDAVSAPDGVARTSPVAVHLVHRRPAGIHPVPLLGGLGLVTLVATIILLAAGSLAAGLILLGLAAALLTLFFGGIRRDPDAPAARLTITAADRVRARSRLVAITTRAWSRAGLDLLRIRRRQRRLRSELKASLAPLGEAVYHDDQQRAQALKQQAADLEQQVAETERAATGVTTAAREEIQRERTAIEQTQAFVPVEGTDGEVAAARPADNGQRSRSDRESAANGRHV